MKLKRKTKQRSINKKRPKFNKEILEKNQKIV